MADTGARSVFRAKPSLAPGTIGTGSSLLVHSHPPGHLGIPHGLFTGWPGLLSSLPFADPFLSIHHPRAPARSSIALICLDSEGVYCTERPGIGARHGPIIPRQSRDKTDIP